MTNVLGKKWNSKPSFCFVEPREKAAVILTRWLGSRNYFACGHHTARHLKSFYSIPLTKWSMSSMYTVQYAVCVHGAVCHSCTQSNTPSMHIVKHTIPAYSTVCDLSTHYSMPLEHAEKMPHVHIVQYAINTHSRACHLCIQYSMAFVHIVYAHSRVCHLCTQHSMPLVQYSMLLEHTV